MQGNVERKEMGSNCVESKTRLGSARYGTGEQGQTGEEHGEDGDAEGCGAVRGGACVAGAGRNEIVGGLGCVWGAWGRGGCGWGTNNGPGG